MEIISKMNRMNSSTGSFVEGGLLPNPKVDSPIQRSSWIHEGVQDDVAVALVKFAVAGFFHLDKNTIKIVYLNTEIQ
jgi:hypothetical protein